MRVKMGLGVLFKNLRVLVTISLKYGSVHVIFSNFRGVGLYSLNEGVCMTISTNFESFYGFFPKMN